MDIDQYNSSATMYRQSDNYNPKQCKRCNNIVSYGFLWIRRAVEVNRMLNYYCMLFSSRVSVRVRIIFSDQFVSGYSHVFILATSVLPVVVVTLPQYVFTSYLRKDNSGAKKVSVVTKSTTLNRLRPFDAIKTRIRKKRNNSIVVENDQSFGLFANKTTTSYRSPMNTSIRLRRQQRQSHRPTYRVAQ